MDSFGAPLAWEAFSPAGYSGAAAGSAPRQSDNKLSMLRIGDTDSPMPSLAGLQPGQLDLLSILLCLETPAAGADHIKAAMQFLSQEHAAAGVAQRASEAWPAPCSKLWEIEDERHELSVSPHLRAGGLLEPCVRPNGSRQARNAGTLLAQRPREPCLGQRGGVAHAAVQLLKRKSWLCCGPMTWCLRCTHTRKLAIIPSAPHSSLPGQRGTHGLRRLANCRPSLSQEKASSGLQITGLLESAQTTLAFVGPPAAK